MYFRFSLLLWLLWYFNFSYKSSLSILYYTDHDNALTIESTLTHTYTSLNNNNYQSTYPLTSQTFPPSGTDPHKLNFFWRSIVHIYISHLCGLSIISWLYPLLQMNKCPEESKALEEGNSNRVALAEGKLSFEIHFTHLKFSTVIRAARDLDFKGW